MSRPTNETSKYRENSEWADVEPLPNNDGGPGALATIAYNDEYREASEYLRAVMAANEHSERVLKLTAHIISLNPAHYTVWLYRAKTLEILEKPVPEEIEWLNQVALKHIKNYQIWHHRQLLLSRLKRQLDAEGDSFDPTEEMHFLNEMFEKDTKNYHVWSYRQWLVKTFGLWDHPSELADVDEWLRDDVMNNSAWNHRWFLCFGQSLQDKSWKPSDALIERELDFCKSSIDLEPRNESAWNYLTGLIKRADRPLSDVKDFTNKFVVSFDSPADIQSEYAAAVMAQIYEEDGQKEEAAKGYDMLGKRIDQIRHNYWAYRKASLNINESVSAAT